MKAWRSVQGTVIALCIALAILFTVIRLAVNALFPSNTTLADDAPIEEAIEDIIEVGTGADVDLTPGSKE